MGPLKMLARYYGVELQAATVASVLGLAVTSPYDEEEVRGALEATGVGPDQRCRRAGISITIISANAGVGWVTTRA